MTLRWAGGQKPPAVLADRERRPGVDGQPPDRGAQPVGADDHVVLATTAVVEADLDRPVQVLQRLDGAAKLHRHALAQDLVQLGPGQGQAGTDIPPQPVQVDLGEQVPAVVEEALTGDPGPTGGHSALQAKGPQGTDAVGGQVHAGPADLPSGLAFDHLRGEPGLVQRPGQRQTGQPSPHDQDPVMLHRRSSMLAGSP